MSPMKTAPKRICQPKVAIWSWGKPLRIRATVSLKFFVVSLLRDDNLISEGIIKQKKKLVVMGLFCFVFETRSHFVVQAGLNLTT